MLRGSSGSECRGFRSSPWVNQHCRYRADLTDRVISAEHVTPMAPRKESVGARQWLVSFFSDRPLIE